MFKKTPVEKQPIPFTQKLITFGLILFFLYFYFTDFQVKQLEKQKLLVAGSIKVTNLISKDVTFVDAKTPGKTVITIDKALLDKASGSKIAVLEIEVPPAAAEPANLTK